MEPRSVEFRKGRVGIEKLENRGLPWRLSWSMAAATRRRVNRARTS